MPDTSRTAPEPPSRRSIRITTRTAVLVVVVVLAVLLARNVFTAAARVLGWAAASAAVALLVEPIVTVLGRVIPRVAAVLLTFLVVGAGIGALVFGTVADLDREVDRLQRSAPAATERLEARDDELGEVMRDLRVSDRVDEFLDELDERVGSGGGTLAQNAPTAPIYFVCAILTIFLLIYGPGMVEGAAGQVADPDLRARLLRSVHDGVRQARRTVAAMLAQGLVVGALFGGIAAAIDLPAPIVLGLVAGVAATLPDLGILLGVLPTVALAGGLESARVAVAILALAFVLQGFEALWLRTRVDRWGVAIGPAVVWIVALVGYTIHGVGMAAYGIGYAVLAIAVLEQLGERAVDHAVPVTDAAPTGV